MRYAAFVTVVVMSMAAGSLTASAPRRDVYGASITTMADAGHSASSASGEWGSQGDAGRLELFDDKDFRGKSSALTRSSPELGSMSGRADSLRLSGTWQICDQENFRGRCRIVSENIADLNRIGWKNRIRSARPR